MVKKVYRNKGSKKNIVISLAGVHGIGKTTLFTLLKKKLGNDNKFKFYPERYIKKPPFPFGSRNKQIAFRSEIHFLQQFIKRNRSVTNFIKRYNGRILIMDRTPLCVLIYSKSLYLKEKDYKLLVDMYNSVDWKEDYIIYLNAKPKIILKRIIQRGSLEKMRKKWNEEEKDYLLEILSYYKQLLLSDKRKKVIMVDTSNRSPEEILNELINIISELSGFSFNKFNKQPDTQSSLFKFI
ncbi:MAG: AAA family ATPase [Candidatus Lokiarchaeota archaeon]|nr:AAA family ATPase [Candidatus Lokiarchaeota archaeon]